MVRSLRKLFGLLNSQFCTGEISGQQFCRPGMPYPSMSSTQILQILPETTQNLERHEENFSRIKKFLI